MHAWKAHDFFSSLHDLCAAWRQHAFCILISFHFSKNDDKTLTRWVKKEGKHLLKYRIRILLSLFNAACQFVFFKKNWCVFFTKFQKGKVFNLYKTLIFKYLKLNINTCILIHFSFFLHRYASVQGTKIRGKSDHLLKW